MELDELERAVSENNDSDINSDGRSVTKDKELPLDRKPDISMPVIYLVHYTVLRQLSDRHKPSELLMLADETETKELVFHSDLSNFRAGDLVQEFVQQEAMRLLRDVFAATEPSTQDTRKTIVFVAYDLGALVIKEALSIAAGFGNKYSSIFWNTSTVIFSGCPQRSNDLSAMISKLWALLSSVLDGTSHGLLAPENLKHLAHIIIQTSEDFIGTKIALRSCIIHLYAGKDEAGIIHRTLDAFTATMGLPSETAIQEQGGDDLASQFPGLRNTIAHKIKNAASHPHWQPIEQTLLALAAPPITSKLDPREVATLQPVLDAQEFVDWDGAQNSQILHIQGQSRRFAHSVAHQIMLNGVAKLRKRGNYSSSSYLSFCFDSRDPQRRSIPDMMNSILVQIISDNCTFTINKEFHFLRNLYLMGVGWNEKSSISLFYAFWSSFFGHRVVIILYDFDECDADSRKTFLDWYSTKANKMECPLKLLITSRERNDLAIEQQQWFKLDINAYIPDATSDTPSLVADSVRLCPSDERRQEMQKQLDRLSTMEPTTLCIILRMLSDHTSWPDNPSARSLSEFIRLLSLISPSDTPKRALDKIIKIDKQFNQLRLVLGWILCSYRPLNMKQLVTVKDYYDNSNGAGPEPPVHHLSTQVSMEARSQLEYWLRMLIDSRDGQVTIRDHIMSLLIGNIYGEYYIWNEITDEAHQKLAEFCFAYFKSDESVATLNKILVEYESSIQDQRRQFKIATLVLPKDQGLLLYAVQALPYHLSKCPHNYRTKALSFFFHDSTATASTIWAKLYWAMSNPLSRTSKSPESALPLCASFGFVNCEELSSETENMQVQCMSSAIIGGRGSEVLSLFPPRALSVPAYMELLLSALQANDQTLALDLIQGVISHSDWRNNEKSWPRFAIWAAVWLNMVDVTKTLLDNGVGVDDTSSVEPTIGHYPSILYLASILNHPAIVETLLARGATSEIPILATNGSFQAAAYRGHIEVIQKYLNHDSSYIKDKKPETALWAASQWGCWYSISALIDAGADVNEPQGRSQHGSHACTPLVMACQLGYPRTMEALLARGADANGVDVPGINLGLWYPVVDDPNVECVRVMLRYDADPNHPSFDPPLLVQMAHSSHETARLVSICDAFLGGKRPINLNATSDDGQTALMIASRSGKLGLVQWLLKTGADIDVLDDEGKSALYYAIRNRHVDVVAVLLQQGARIDVAHASGEEPLIFDAISYPEIVRLLLEFGADANLPNSYGNRAINIASTAGDVEVAKMLIEKGADINHKDDSGWTPIFDAVACSPSVSLTRLLAENGAQLDDTLNGNTLLHLAVHQDLEIIKVLLEFRKSIKINAHGRYGATALHAAIYQSDVQYLKALIRAGADINARDTDGETPLHRAAANAKTLDHLKLFLSQPDVDIDNVSSNWGSPLCIASLHLNVEGVRTLLDSGADVNIAIPNIMISTPLISVLGTHGNTTRKEDIPIIDVIARMLAFNPLNKAKIKQRVPGNVFYTALSAACCSAGPATINFLVEAGAEVHLADPVSGRLPHHFAAMNGLDNFQAIVLFYQYELMASDKEQKNCLHWAAQFGNLRTVEFIISRLRDEKKLEFYINKADSDGWTPLCWAARPHNEGWAKRMRSEKPDFGGVVRTLLLNGARRDVKCTLGNGIDNEILTLLDLARRCDAGHDIIQMIQYGLLDRAEDKMQNGIVAAGPVRIYVMQDNYVCSMCLNPVFGMAFECKTCSCYGVCSKCLSHSNLLHRITPGDEEEHRLEKVTRFQTYRAICNEEERGGDGATLDGQVTDNSGDEDLGGASPEMEEELLDLDGIEI